MYLTCLLVSSSSNTDDEIFSLGDEVVQDVPKYLMSCLYALPFYYQLYGQGHLLPVVLFLFPCQ